MSLSILGLLIASAEAVPLSSVPAGGLVISEIMHDPSVVADYRGEYIEIFNNHSAEVDLNGLQLDSGETGATVNQSIVVPVGGYAVLAARSSSGLNGGNTEVDFQYSYSTFKLGKNDTVIISAGSTTFDTVTYNTSSYPVVTGASLILDSDTLTASGNDTGSNWCTSGNVYGSGDTGTPGASNDGCSSVADLNIGDLVITEIMWDPTFVADYRGEWIEVYNASSGSLNLNGLIVTSTSNPGHTISGDVVVAAGARSLLNVRSSSLVNGGTNGDYTYDYSQVSLGKNDSVGLEASGVTIDSVSYGFSSHSLESGKSITLAPGILSASGNDTSSNWCAGSSIYGDGDIGTPGSTNDACGNVDADGDGFNADVDCDDSDVAITVNTYFLDNDGDTFGSSSSGTTTGCTVPSGYSELNTDCNDGNSNINPDASETCDGVDNDCDSLVDDADTVDSGQTTYYLDSDDDTYGDDTGTCSDGVSTTPENCVAAGETWTYANFVDACDQPTDGSSDGFSHVLIDGDCNDSDLNINPGGNEVLGNGVDENCDGVDNTGTDSDGDGFIDTADCNDGNAAINPGAAEVCDGVDNDCNGLIDDDDTPTDPLTWFVDSDSDGFGGSTTSTACNQPAGAFATQQDCDDSSSSIFPGATETTADGIDQDCNNGDICFADGDDDGFRTDLTVSSADLDCNDSGEAGSAVPNTDCDDSDSAINPNATEVCDSVDNDCDSDIDDNDSSIDASVGGSLFFFDSDNDLYGDPGNSIQACSRPSGYMINNTDCDDTDFNKKPVDKDGDGVDMCSNDCDDDDATSFAGAAENESTTDCMTDADGDGYGDTSAPTGGVAGTDCDDTDTTVSPVASEICDGKVNTCGSSLPTNETDDDSDTYVECTIDAGGWDGVGSIVGGDDCNDGDSAINTAATETCDSVDNDCDSLIDDDDTGVTGQTSFFVDGDLDGFGGTSTVDACSQPASTFVTSTDCDDANSAINPGATEVCDSVDNDCDTLIDEDGGSTTFFRDVDGDSYGINSDTQTACTAPTGYVALNNDCNDSDVSVNPGAAEVCLDGIDSDCDSTDSLGSCDGDIANSDLTITGVSSGDRLGQAISYAGNITGTTARDFILGSRLASSEDGAVYIFDGSASFSGTSSASTATTITGASGERFGFSVAGGTNLLGGITSDFNGDGNDDLLVGAPNADVGGSPLGAAYMFYGPIAANTTSSAANAVFTGQVGQDSINPANHNAVNTGYAVAFVGDVNSDGYADIAIGDPSKKNSGSTNGEAYLIFGRGNTFDGSEVQLTSQYEGTNSLNEASWRAQFGREILSDGTDREQMGSAIDAIGDVNGDGIDDLAVGAYRWDASSGNPNLNNGGVFVWYGGTSLTSNATLTVSHTIGNNTADVTIVGSSSGDQIGRSLSGAGDFNGDGQNDIVIGSEHANSSAGLVMIVDGSGNTIAEFTGEVSGDGSGRWVSSLGNIDSDGDNTSDILVGSKYANANGSESGAAYIILGGTAVSGTNSLSSAEVLLNGAAAGNRTGGNVSSVDDLDGDGVSELLVGAELTNSEQGAVHFIYSSTFQ
jgi:hypothetical protein